MSAQPSTQSTAHAVTVTEVVLPGVVEPDGVFLSTREMPAPGDGQALVRVLVTGVSYAENSMRRNRYPGQPRFPFVPGYDLVGEVIAVGRDVDAGVVGTRVAAITKTGGWATHALLDARDLLPVPGDLDPAAVETVLLNGITAWQMLQRSAGVHAGQTILVHGASGGVGSLLVQLARHEGIRVVGTGSSRSHTRLAELGAEPFDYRDPDLARKLAGAAPGGYDAIFDNIGGASFERSFRQLARGGTLVAYGTAGERDKSGSMVLAFVEILGRFARWSITPNGGRSATFYNFWGGHSTRPRRFRARLRTDLGSILELVAGGQLAATVAARFPLEQAARALAFADVRTAHGKVIIEP